MNFMSSLQKKKVSNDVVKFFILTHRQTLKLFLRHFLIIFITYTTFIDRCLYIKHKNELLNIFYYKMCNNNICFCRMFRLRYFYYCIYIVKIMRFITSSNCRLEVFKDCKLHYGSKEKDIF